MESPRFTLMKEDDDIDERRPVTGLTVDTTTDGDNNDKALETSPPHSSPSSRDFAGGSLKANLAAAATNDGYHIRRDPLLEAVAAGAAVRKAKQQKLKAAKLETVQQPTTNEWTLSLRRFASVAASAAKTVATVTAPVLRDATDVVVSSATEFVHDVQEEYQKKDSTAANGATEEETLNHKDEGNDDESTSLLATPRSSNSTRDLLHAAEAFLPSLGPIPTVSPSSIRTIPASAGTHRTRLSSLPDVEEAIVEEIEITKANDGEYDVRNKEDMPEKDSGTDAEQAPTIPNLADVANENTPTAVKQDNETEAELEISRRSESYDSNDGMDADLAKVFAQVDSKLTSICADIMSGDDSGSASATKEVEEEEEVVARQDPDPVQKSHDAPVVEPKEDTTNPEVDDTAAALIGSVSGNDVPENIADADGAVTATETPVQKESFSEPPGIPEIQSILAINPSGERADGILGKQDSEEVSEDFGIQTKVSMLRWIPNPFLSGSETLEDSERVTTKQSSEDAGAAVETLSTYDNVPLEFTAATQAIRNYHANVQTMKECETNEQRLMCSSVCDDTYKSACKLVAEVDTALEHQDFQSRLLDDLRRLRELQKTIYVDVDDAKRAESQGQTESDHEVHDMIQDHTKDLSEEKEPIAALESIAAEESTSSEEEALVSTEDYISLQQGFTNETDHSIHSDIDDVEKAVQVEPVIKQLRGVEDSVVRHYQAPHGGRESLFDGGPEGIYERISGDKESIETNSAHYLPETKASMMSFENPFKDRKRTITFIVSKLTGFDVEIKERSDNANFLDKRPGILEPLPKSVFDRHSDDRSSSSSLSTPTLGGISSEEGDCNEQPSSRLDEGDFPFDFTPRKHTIVKTKSELQSSEGVEGNEGRKPVLASHLSSTSLNESLGSISTRQKSFGSRSLPVTPRRLARRLRRQADSKVRSPIPSPPVRSPYETPVEEMSLNDPKPTELTITDHGGELVGWDREREAIHPNVPDTEEMTEALVDRTGFLDETLMTFSTLENVDFLAKTPLDCERDPRLEDVGRVFWQQLLANYKHNELWKGLSANSISLNSESTAEFEADDNSSTATIPLIKRRLASNEVVLKRHIATASPRYDGFSLLTRYLSDVGPAPAPEDKSQAIKPLRHEFSDGDSSGSNESDLDPKNEQNIDFVRSKATALQQQFGEVLSSIVHFASQNCATLDDVANLAWSTDIKEKDAIHEKARRQYNGDILSVKDVLRGQITFPELGSLICGLYALHMISKGEAKLAPREGLPRLEIIRMKNLFRVSNSGRQCFEPLPTGYRHVLVNIRFENGFIAELQFQLAQLFGILGNEGYLLHKELLSAKYELKSEVGPEAESASSTKRSQDAQRKNAHEFICALLQPQLPDKKGTSDRAGDAVTKIVQADSHTQTCVASNPIDEHAAMTAHATGRKPQPKNVEPNEISTVPVGGGIAALAAQAALKKSQSKTPETDSTPPAPSAGGIAVLAAQAALKKSKANTAKPNATSFPPAPPAGGIAALAAQVALNKTLSKSAESNNVPPPALPAGGIAALAAQAAFKKSQEKVSESDSGPPTPPAGGIAALGAQAALKKSKDKVSESDSGPPTPPAGAIAALAAQATLKKSQDKVSESDSGPPSPPAREIAALAAQAALKKSQNKVSESDSGPPALPTGGIAALAAQAALKKSQEKVSESDNGPPALTAGGIAALTAQAVLKKSQTNAPGVGSKAALEAQAAANNSQAPLAPPSGGVAALAAQPLYEEPQNGNIGSSAGDSNSFDTDMLFIAAIFEAGISEAISNPRDLPCFYCLYLVSTRIQKQIHLSDEKGGDSVPRDELSIFLQKLLLRCLAISNQATSIGMVGWLEYGSSNPLERSLRLPFELLQQLACTMATREDWDGTVSVLSSLVRRCCEDLSPCHPTTLSAMLDLAGAMTRVDNQRDAASIARNASDLLSSFLAEQERQFFHQLRLEEENRETIGDVVYYDDNIDALVVLHAFALDFRNDLSRGFLCLLGPNDHITLLNHSLVADTVTVLANCLSFLNESAPDPNENSSYFWWLAYRHHKIAFRGWVKISSLSDPYSAAAACSIARCLREIDKLDQAIAILETLASCLEKHVDIEEKYKLRERESDEEIPSVVEEKVDAQQEQIRVHCLWTLAVMTVQKSPDERGRQRALSLLHTASLALQRVLKRKDLDDDTRRVCMTLYRTVEQEALGLFEPLQQLFVPEAPKPTPVIDGTARPKKASWEVRTPMREKREEWISPRQQRLAKAAAELKEQPKALFVQLV